ncbi:MAG: amidohydrolase [Candidatus Rokuibacteriota bacterium]|nr:MAG: amidohydrolase [Candidatus Rokubacteria bacterium]
MSESIARAKWVVRGVRNRQEAEIVEDGAVHQRDGTIVAVGKYDDIRRAYPQLPVLGSADHVILPGFINSHHHVGLTPLQLGSPDHPLELWFASRMSKRDVDLYLDTLYSAFEMIESGITTVQHIHGWMPGPVDNIYQGATHVLRAYRTIGMRASYSFAVREQNRLVYDADAEFVKRLPPDLAPAIAPHLASQAIPFKDNLWLFDQLVRENQSEKLTRIQLSPANLHWCTDESLVTLKERADRAKVPMHIHLVETAYQKEYARRRTGTTALKHLHRLGLLGPPLTLGHSVWLTQEDIELAADTGTCICHNCSSNLRLRSGVAPLNVFEAKGMTIAMGLDEAGINDDRDMLQEIRLVLRLHRVPGMEDVVPTCPQVLRMATEHGAKTTPFGAEIGRLDPGRLCDLVLISWRKATWPYQDEDVPMLDALLQRAKTNAVDAVLIGGETVYENGRFTRIDRDAVMKEIAAALNRPRSPEEERRRWMAKAVFPHVRKFYDGYLDKAVREPFYQPSSRI